MKSETGGTGQGATATDPAHSGNVGLHCANPTYHQNVSGTAVAASPLFSNRHMPPMGFLDEQGADEPHEGKPEQ
jgi:hypothetical protein